MIGSVTIPAEPNREAVVLLDDQGDLHFRGYDLPEFREAVGALFDLYKRTYGPARGPFGVEFLNKIARKFDGRAIISPRESSGEVTY